MCLFRTFGLQFSTDFYKVWFSGICRGQRLYSLIFIKIFACLRPLRPPKPRKTFLLHNGVYCFAVRAPGGAKVPLPRYLDIYLSAVILLLIIMYLKNEKVDFMTKQISQNLPRRTETAIVSIAGRSPAFCEFSKI